MNFKLSTQGKAHGTIRLAGSKSISNRVLIIRALSGQDFAIDGLASAADTVTMERLLRDAGGTLDVGPAGTTFRFLTAYLAMQPDTQVLTGSARMKERPIGPLVDALNGLGCRIEYLEKTGYPPLQIHAPDKLTSGQEVTIPATISSQFISALLMIAPYLPGGLRVVLEGDLVSPSYLKMTLSAMKYFGVEANFEGQIIEVSEGAYQGRDVVIEADWSAASYHYATVALAEDAEIRLDGLFPNSWQGDSVCASLFAGMGVQSSWDGQTLCLAKSSDRLSVVEHDFIDCPDLAQTVAAVCAGLGQKGIYRGLETLKIKETDRIAALKTELGKLGTRIYPIPKKFSGTSKETYLLEGQADWKDLPSFATYHDHRMAMALAPLAWINPVLIEDAAVVEKSYPEFWKHMSELGMDVELVDG